MFTAYITDQRVFLIDKNERKPGVTSKELPREVIISSILESAETDPFLVLNIRTSPEESRTMKIAFVEEGADRTHEIEEWINILHGRPLRTAKQIVRSRDSAAPAPRPSPAKMILHERTPARAEPVAERVPAGTLGPIHAHETTVPPETIPEGPADREEYGEPETSDILFCHHCGRKLPSGANFCPYCGTKLHRSR